MRVALAFRHIVADQASIVDIDQMHHQVGKQETRFMQPTDDYVIGAGILCQRGCRIMVLEQIADAAIRLLLTGFANGHDAKSCPLQFFLQQRLDRYRTLQFRRCVWRQRQIPQFKIQHRDGTFRSCEKPDHGKRNCCKHLPKQDYADFSFLRHHFSPAAHVLLDNQLHRRISRHHSRVGTTFDTHLSYPCKNFKYTVFLLY